MAVYEHRRIASSHREAISVWDYLLILFRSLNALQQLKKLPQKARDREPHNPIHMYRPLRRLRSSTTSALVAPRTVRSTIGDRTFPATAASVWNSLPESVRSSPSLQVFRNQTENRTFCPVLQTWLRTSYCTDYYYVTSLFRLIVACPCSLRT